MVAATIDKPLDHLQRYIEELRASLALPVYASVEGQQGQILGHFLSRALQMSEASALVCRARLGTPLVALQRILCEDLFLCFWVSMSEKDAAEYSNSVTAEGVKLVRMMLENRRAHIRDVSTHKVRTAEVLSRCEDFKADRINIEQLAKKLGLGKVYDLVYRYSSMEVHGKAFGLP